MITRLSSNLRLPKCLAVVSFFAFPFFFGCVTNETFSLLFFFLLLTNKRNSLFTTLLANFRQFILQSLLLCVRLWKRRKISLFSYVSDSRGLKILTMKSSQLLFFLFSTVIFQQIKRIIETMCKQILSISCQKLRQFLVSQTPQKCFNNWNELLFH
jgi:hypothetical protein